MAEDISFLRNEIYELKRQLGDVMVSVSALETEKDHLRQAVRKLKMENFRSKEKLKKLMDHYKSQKEADGDAGSDEEDFPDYDEIGRDFILVGGSKDPLGIRYEATIEDENGIQHKSAERYYWFKMAEFFEDNKTRDAILAASTAQKAEDAMKEIKGFNDNKWDKVKVGIWEAGQRLKLEQVRWIANLLVETRSSYIAIAHQDKIIGSGWRKNREESNKPIFWDGQNLGGKFLMKYRKQMTEKQTWAGPNEKEEAERKVAELRKFVWRRMDPNHPSNRSGFTSRGGRAPFRGRSGYNQNRGNGDRKDRATGDASK